MNTKIIMTIALLMTLLACDMFERRSTATPAPDTHPPAPTLNALSLGAVQHSTGGDIKLKSPPSRG